jgi:hypothetical protein
VLIRQKRPEKVGRAKAKEPSMHQIGCGNNFGIIAVQEKANQQANVLRQT